MEILGGKSDVEDNIGKLEKGDSQEKYRVYCKDQISSSIFLEKVTKLKVSNKVSASCKTQEGSNMSQIGVNNPEALGKYQGKD